MSLQEFYFSCCIALSLLYCSISVQQCCGFMKVNSEYDCTSEQQLVLSRNFQRWQDTDCLHQYDIKMSKTFLDTFSSIALDRIKCRKSFSSYTVGHSLQFFLFTPKCSNNLCEIEFSRVFLFVPRGCKLCKAHLAFKTGQGSFVQKRGFMHSCRILQMGLVFPYLQ